jgi:hypothetical protein
MDREIMQAENHQTFRTKVSFSNHVQVTEIFFSVTSVILLSLGPPAHPYGPKQLPGYSALSIRHVSVIHVPAE